MVIQQHKLKLVINTKEIIDEDGQSYTGYGFTAYRTDPLTEVFSIEDLSADPKEIKELIRLIQDNDVSVAHFQDMIEDFLV